MLKAAVDSLEGDLGRNEMVKRMEVINNELYTDEYNVARYLEAFNKKVRPLLVCFHPDIRSKILLDIVKTKDKITKKTTEKLKERMIFVHSECGLVCGMPNKVTDQDSYEDLMKMEDKEIRFWDSVDKIPNNMDESEWETLRLDWKERMRIAKIEGIKHEQKSLDEIFKHLEVSEFNHIINTGELPKVAFMIADISDYFNMLISRKWGEELCPVSDIFKYEIQAIERDKYYKLVSIENLDNRYQEYLDYLNEQEVMTGKTMDIFTELVDEVEEITPLEKDTNTLVTLLKEKASEVIVQKEEKKKRVLSESESEEDGEVSEEEDDNGDMVRNDDVIQLDDEIDDTYAELPDDYEQDTTIEPFIEKVEEEDEWGF